MEPITKVLMFFQPTDAADHIHRLREPWKKHNARSSYNCLAPMPAPMLLHFATVPLATRAQLRSFPFGREQNAARLPWVVPTCRHCSALPIAKASRAAVAA